MIAAGGASGHGHGRLGMFYGARGDTVDVASLPAAWLRDEVDDLYCADNGRPGIDPEVAVRLMLAGLLLGIVHDRRLMREAQVNLAMRWFVGYGPHEPLPDP
jgi:hypothetical protein